MITTHPLWRPYHRPSAKEIDQARVRTPAAEVIDIDLTVADSGDEAAWLPALEGLGMTLTVREPEWEQHRCLRGEEPRGNVHVWSPGSIEAQRHVVFRDWLRAHPSDRDDYASTKRAVAAEGHTDVMAYNNAKGAMIYDLYERIFTADPKHPHEGVRRG